jgi:hypothetical protein
MMLFHLFPTRKTVTSFHFYFSFKKKKRGSKIHSSPEASSFCRWTVATVAVVAEELQPVIISLLNRKEEKEETLLIIINASIQSTAAAACSVNRAHSFFTRLVRTWNEPRSDQQTLGLLSWWTASEKNEQVYKKQKS